jgi:hypothetical protein
VSMQRKLEHLGDSVEDSKAVGLVRNSVMLTMAAAACLLPSRVTAICLWQDGVLAAQAGAPRGLRGGQQGCWPGEQQP